MLIENEHRDFLLEMMTDDSLENDEADFSLAALKPVAEAIARLVSPHAEVVIHDLRTRRIAYIANNISRRRVGDPSLNDIAEIQEWQGDAVGPYRKTNFNGRELKSVTAVLRRRDGVPTGLVCINLDTTVISDARDILAALASLDTSAKQSVDLFQSDWREKVNTAISTFAEDRGLAPTALTRPDYGDLFEALDRDGYFAIRNLVPYLARLLGISRATVYKYLRAVREKARHSAG